MIDFHFNTQEGHVPTSMTTFTKRRDKEDKLEKDIIEHANDKHHVDTLKVNLVDH